MSGKLLTFASWRPMPASVYRTTNTQRYLDVDAAHLTVSFVAPPSGLVKVVMYAASANLSPTTKMYWALRGTGGKGPDGVVPGSERYLASGIVFKFENLYEAIIRVSKGREYDWTWAYKAGDARGTYIKIGDNAANPPTGGHGPGVMEVWDTLFAP